LEEQHISRDTRTERVWDVLQSTFSARRIVVILAGAKMDDAAIPNEVCAMRAGGGFGSIIGRNSSQRDRTAALSLLDHMIPVHKGETR
jgi:class I fructose-bisphosphate aldolase